MLAPIAEADPRRAAAAGARPALARAPIRASSTSCARACRHRSRLSDVRHAATSRATRDEAEALDARAGAARALGLAGQPLRPSEARRLEPALAPALRLALDVPDDHAIDPRALTAALAEALRGAGGDDPRRRRGRIELRARRACDRRGAGRRYDRDGRACRDRGRARGRRAPGIARARARIPVRPVKGQILRLHDPAGPGLLTRVLRMRRRYIVPRGDGRYVLGATVEERGFDTASHRRRGLRTAARRDRARCPGVSELVIEELLGRPASRHARQPPDRSALARCPACTGQPATTGTGSCSRR